MQPSNIHVHFSKRASVLSLLVCERMTDRGRGLQATHQVVTGRYADDELGKAGRYGGTVTPLAESTIAVRSGKFSVFFQPTIHHIKHHQASWP